VKSTSTSPFSAENCAPAAIRPGLVKDVLRRAGSVNRLALDCLFPRICVGCGRIGEYLCVECSARLPVLHGPLCPHCGQPQSSGIICPSCAGKPSALSSVRSVFRFEGTVRHAIHELKYRNLRAIAPTLATYLTEHVSTLTTTYDVVIPVPLHPKRLNRRGYNQAELLAREIAEARGVSLSASALRRTRAGESQARTGSMSERHQNVMGAFACTDTSMSGKQVLLIDDVCTTGATLEACAAALRAAGASTVSGLTVAREV
jgi:competence protein ComFC